MKVSTKIILGYVLLILLMGAALVYELSLVDRMHTINENLSKMKTRAGEYSLLSRDIGQIEEFTKKFYVTGAPEYSSQLIEMRRHLSEDLEKIRASQPTPAEARQLQRIIALWERFSSDAARQETRFAEMAPGDFERWLKGPVDGLMREFFAITAANQEAIEAQFEISKRASQKAEYVSQIAALVAFVLAALTTILIVRSISRSLGQLTHGARAVASGEFSYRLDASGTDTFSQVARDFNIMASRLDEMEQLKRDYVSHVSHELKAPLAAIQETTKLVREGLAGPITDKQRHLLGLSLDCGERLTKTIRSLLDLSRIEADALDFEVDEHDLRDLVEAAVAEFELHISQKDRNVQVDLPSEPLLVSCDRDRMLQVLTNLLDNALKFSPPTSPLSIRVAALDHTPDSLPRSWANKIRTEAPRFALVTVADHGPGVPDAHKEQIFEKYHQVKFEKKIAGQGVGLGLVICRNIIQAHGGAIWVEDNPAGGSIFSLLLPGSPTEKAVSDTTATGTGLPRVQPA